MSGYQRLLHRADFAMGVLVLIWTAEALVRFHIGAQITGLVYLYFAFRFAMTLPAFLPVLLRAAPVLVYPLVCLTSAFWSVMPAVTLIAAVQIAFTIMLGLFLGTQFRLLDLARMILIALGLTMLLSLTNFGGLWGQTYSWEGGFLGIYTNKNALGQRGALLALTALFLFLADPSRWIRWLAVLVLGLTGALLALSKSATSILLALAFGTGFLLRASADRRSVRPWLWLTCLVVLSCVVVTLTLLRIDPWAAILAAFDKNPTLTGRTALWAHGMDMIAKAPLLGQGAMAYWVAPDFSPEISHLRSDYGATVTAFHNFVIEVLVGLGLPGLLALLLLIGSSIRAVWSHGQGASRRWALWTLALLVLLSLLGSSLYRQHEITLMLVVALGASAQQSGLSRRAGQGVR